MADLDVAVANDAPHFPETLYGICKSANERLSALYFERFGVEVITMRQTVDVLAELLPDARLELEPGRTGLVWREDTAALREQLGVGAPVTVREGFARTVATLRAWRDAGTW